jgi:uncharacterized protein involved in exopolysaccharide biosynthesis
MSILQFFRILWARRLLILLTTVVTTLVMVVVCEVVPPTYEAQTRVMLDVLKPDPVTGEVMATAFLRAYVKTQIELLEDEGVAREVVQSLKWEKNKEFLKEYRNRNVSDDRDFTRWAAQKVTDGVDAKVIEASNVLEIDYDSHDPDRAKAVADALRDAYIATTLKNRQDAARRNADWYEAQAAKAKDALFAAEETKSKFERDSGIVLADDKTDLDSARLAALANAAGAPVQPGVVAPPSSLGAAQLAQMDSALLEASRVLGPNHPQLIELRRRRELLAQQVEEERKSASAAANAGANAQRVTAGMLDAQKAKVLAQRDKVERVRLLADDVNMRREEYNKAAARAAELRQEAEVSEAGVTPLGSAVTPQTPKFPVKIIMIPVAFFGGIALGVVVAIGLELLGRRIRSAEDLRIAIKAPVLAVVTRPHTRTGLHIRDRLKRWFMRSRPGRFRPAQV